MPLLFSSFYLHSPSGLPCHQISPCIKITTDSQFLIISNPNPSWFSRLFMYILYVVSLYLALLSDTSYCIDQVFHLTFSAFKFVLISLYPPHVYVMHVHSLERKQFLSFFYFLNLTLFQILSHWNCLLLSWHLFYHPEYSIAFLPLQHKSPFKNILLTLLIISCVLLLPL